MVGISLQVIQPVQAEDNGKAPTEFEFFEILYKNNIFDPNRRPYVAPRPREERPVRRDPVIETFKLSGVMKYDGKSFAIFDGSSSSFRGKKDAGESIGELKISSVGIDKVTLEESDAKSEVFKLVVGQSLTRTDGGEWKPFLGNYQSGLRYASSNSRSFGSSSSSQSDEAQENESDTPSTSDDENEILKKLLERRKRELE